MNSTATEAPPEGIAVSTGTWNCAEQLRTTLRSLAQQRGCIGWRASVVNLKFAVKSAEGSKGCRRQSCNTPKARVIFVDFHVTLDGVFVLAGRAVRAPARWTTFKEALGLGSFVVVSQSIVSGWHARFCRSHLESVASSSNHD